MLSYEVYYNTEVVFNAYVVTANMSKQECMIQHIFICKLIQ
jgi:hypothetical protein